jgi:hypothetical protein
MSFLRCSRAVAILVVAAAGAAALGAAGCGRDPVTGVNVRRDGGGAGGTGGSGGGAADGGDASGGRDGAGDGRPGDGGTDVVPGSVQVTLQPSPAPPLPVGHSLQFRAFVVIAGVNRDVTTSLRWSTADPAVAEVSELGGRVVAMRAGRTRLEATDALLGTAGVDVVVTGSQVSQLLVAPPALQLAVGATRPLQVQAQYRDGSSADVTLAAAWLAGDARIARVGTGGLEPPGLVTAVMAGDSTVSAAFAGASAQVMVAVTATGGEVTLSVFPTMQTAPVGSTARFQASARLPSGAVPDVTSMSSWTSSASNVAAAVGSGQYRCMSAGMTMAVARFMGAMASGLLQCGGGPATVRELRLSPLNALVVGTRYRLEATAVFADGREQRLTNEQVTWQSGDSTIATVDPAGVMQGLKAGTVTITGRFSGASGQERYTFMAP